MGDKAVNPANDLRSEKRVNRVPARVRKRRSKRIRGGFGPAAPVYSGLRKRCSYRGTVSGKLRSRDFRPKRKDRAVKLSPSQ